MSKKGAKKRAAKRRSKGAQKKTGEVQVPYLPAISIARRVDGTTNVQLISAPPDGSPPRPLDLAMLALNGAAEIITQGFVADVQAVAILQKDVKARDAKIRSLERELKASRAKASKKKTSKKVKKKPPRK